MFPKKDDIIARLVYKVQLCETLYMKGCELDRRHDNDSHERLGLIKKDNMIGCQIVCLSGEQSDGPGDRLNDRLADSQLGWQIVNLADR